MTVSPPTMGRNGAVDLDEMAEELDRGFRDASFPVQVAGRESSIRLGWELFDDPHGGAKIMVVRFMDPAAAEGQRLAGKLTAVIRPRSGGGVLLDCTSPFHGIALRTVYQRQGVVGAWLRHHVLPILPEPAAVMASAGRGTAAGVALSFFRAYMEQRRGADWLDSEEGRRWWRFLPQTETLDWEAAGGYPAIFGVLRAAGCRLYLDAADHVLALRNPVGDPLSGEPLD